MPAVRRPPPRRTPPPPPRPRAAAPPAPRPAARPAAPRPAARAQARPAARQTPARAAQAARAPGRPAAQKPAARAAPKHAAARPAAHRPAAHPAPRPASTAAHGARKPAPKGTRPKTRPQPPKGKRAPVTKAPVATAAQSTGWKRVLASVYDAGGQGGSCGNTSDGHFHFAELGVAGSYGHGAASGRGNIARAFGRPGQLSCGFGLYVRYKGRTTYATKSDVGYGNTSLAPNAPNQRSIDLLRNLAVWLHFDGVDWVEVAFHTSGAAPAPPVVEKVRHYFNPLEHARVTPERIDQGVDYAGTGYYTAIADGIVTENAPGGWGSFGNYLEYKITQPGPLEGAYVYVAEGIHSVVHKGERISGGARICDFIPGWHSGTEIGFAAGNGKYWSYYRYHDGIYDEKSATRPGIAMSNLIASLGGPAGRIEGPEVGKWPEYIPNGDLSGVTNTLPAGGETPGTQFTAQDAEGEATLVDWGASVKKKWHDLQAGSYTMAHHSGSAKSFAAGKTFLTTGG